jgi:predicted O-linked N-acetylglucosamine transferase (SPINDLY family)
MEIDSSQTSKMNDRTADPSLKERFSSGHNSAAATNDRLLARAVQLRASGNRTKARWNCRQALTSDPRNAKAWHLLSLISLDEGDVDEAISNLHIALSFEPDSATFYSTLCTLLLKAGRPDDALASGEKALSLAPDLPDAHNNIGNVYINLRRIPEAIDSFETAIVNKPEYAEAHYNLGNALLGSDDSEKALVCFEKALEHNPRLWQAQNNRGNALLNLERADEALSAFTIVCEQAEHYAGAHDSRGKILFEKGDLDQALAAFEKAVEIDPGLAAANNNRGSALFALERFDEAEVALKEAVRVAPSSAEAHYRLGVAQFAQHKFAEAIEAYDKSIELNASDAATHYAHGHALLALKKNREGLEAIGRSLELQPRAADVHFEYGELLEENGRPLEAIAAYGRANELNPEAAIPYVRKANVLRGVSRLDEALIAADKAIALDPVLAIAHNARGTVLKNLWRVHEARDALTKALEIAPDLAAVHNNLGNVHKAMVNFEDAKASYEAAMELAPGNIDYVGNYLFCLNYDPAQGTAELAENHVRAMSTCVDECADFIPDARSLNPDRSLRVGLVSADFGRHPTGYFLEGVMKNANADQVTYYCYSGRKKIDDVTLRFMDMAEAWRSTLGVSGVDLQKMVRDDQIDILIDLSGFTAGTRVLTFSQKSAPIQMTWLGSCHTTGLGTIDYILVDPTYVPAGDEAFFTEECIRLPDIRWTYFAPDYAPEVKPPPCVENGYVTFGSFNNLTKLNDQVLDLWARVLSETPNSKLLLSWRSFCEVAQRNLFIEALAARGIGAERLEFIAGGKSHKDVLDEYRLVDIALDPFPFSGCTTTCELLYMGVPLVTLPNRRPASRQSLGFLSTIDRMEWVAKDEDDYVRIATRMAADQDRLAAMRSEQRSRILGSPMSDHEKMARNVEAAFRKAWHKWCFANQ